MHFMLTTNIFLTRECLCSNIPRYTADTLHGLPLKVAFLVIHEFLSTGLLFPKRALAMPFVPSLSIFFVLPHKDNNVCDERQQF